MSKRRKFTPDFKARVVLEELTGVKSKAEICREHRLKPQVFSRWRVEFLERAEAHLSKLDRYNAPFNEATRPTPRQRVLSTPRCGKLAGRQDRGAEGLRERSGWPSLKSPLFRFRNMSIIKPTSPGAGVGARGEARQCGPLLVDKVYYSVSAPKRNPGT